jgi:hypothetical protein
MSTRRGRSVFWLGCGFLLLGGAVYGYLWNAGVTTDATVLPDGYEWICQQSFRNESVRTVRVSVQFASIDGFPGAPVAPEVTIGPRGSRNIDLRFPHRAVSSNRAVLFKSQWRWSAGDEQHVQSSELWLAPGKD